MSAVKLQSANNGLGTEGVGGCSQLFPSSGASCNFDGKRRKGRGCKKVATNCSTVKQPRHKGGAAYIEERDADKQVSSIL